ncbi:septation protein SepH [Mycolicibacterium arenosum]|uniref:Septation protein SepH n=1 Tax=Mycolicibacterium arenosum TaxID=2952157 RepID=A0ABT1LXI3_9MYCO|nr:septation protein SepH [Mycolicibacterium sp. CAU 1645]MCP9271600.1 septation protein SepH [Mycolicibacterium sp. CAU 1645]
MRELNVVGLDVDGKRIICETSDASEKFILDPDDRLHAALRGEVISSSKPNIEVEVPTVLRPKDIQSRIRAGASVDQVAAASGMERHRVERFAHPVLLERARAAELATAAHPVLSDGPAVMTLLETITAALISRGLDPEATTWDAWRNEDGRWTVQLAWKAGRSDNVAHFRFSPGAHGGTATAFDDAASELIDPDFNRPPLRSVAPVAEPVVQPAVSEPHLPLVVTPEPVAVVEPEPKPAPKQRARKRKPEVPGWEDVLLGVRSGTQP